MAPRALAEVLTDFASPPLYQQVPANPPVEPIGRAEPAPPALDVAAIVAAEVAAAEGRLADRLGQEHREALAALEARHEEEMEAQRQALGAQAAELLTARLDGMAAHIAGSSASIAARILGTLVADDIRDRSLAAMQEAIVAALEDGEAVRIRVSGPSGLCEAIASGLGRHADRVDFAAGEGFDLTVTIDDSILETRLGEWSTALSEVLE